MPFLVDGISLVVVDAVVVFVFVVRLDDCDDCDVMKSFLCDMMTMIRIGIVSAGVDDFCIVSLGVCITNE